MPTYSTAGMVNVRVDRDLGPQGTHLHWFAGEAVGEGYRLRFSDTAVDGLRLVRELERGPVTRWVPTAYCRIEQPDELDDGGVRDRLREVSAG